MSCCCLFRTDCYHCKTQFSTHTCFTWAAVDVDVRDEHSMAMLSNYCFIIEDLEEGGGSKVE